MGAIERLEKWRNSHKRHAVEIGIDNGYGATCWVVKLMGSSRLDFSELDLMREDDDSCDWPGLEKTIHAALDEAEKRNI